MILQKFIVQSINLQIFSKTLIVDLCNQESFDFIVIKSLAETVWTVKLSTDQCLAKSGRRWTLIGTFCWRPFLLKSMLRMRIRGSKTESWVIPVFRQQWLFPERCGVWWTWMTPWDCRSQSWSRASQPSPRASLSSTVSQPSVVLMSTPGTSLIKWGRWRRILKTTGKKSQRKIHSNMRIFGCLYQF